MLIVLMVMALHTFSLTLIHASQGSVGDIAVRYNERNHAQDVRLLAAHVERFLFEYGRLPISEVELRALPGYESLQSVKKPSIRFTVVNNVSGPSYGFNRIIVSSPYRLYTESHEYLIDDNACGADRNSPDYCLTNRAYWSLIEDRTLLNFRASKAALHVDAVFKKLGLANAAGGIPKVIHNGTELTQGQTIMLSEAVGYAGNATNCTGVFSFAGVALTCRDIFDLYGNDIAYTYLGDNGFAVVITLDPLVADEQPKNLIRAGYL